MADPNTCNVDNASCPTQHCKHWLRLCATVSRDAASKLLEGLPDRHSKARAQLRQQHQQHYAAWLFELEAGFSLCFYGFGSKRSLLKVET
jgi:Origin recognition complex subunit 2